MVTTNKSWRFDPTKYKQLRANHDNERKAKKILSELGIQTASEPYQSGPFIPFKPFDDGTEDIEKYRGQEMYYFPKEGGQGEFLFPFVQKENVKDLFIAQNTNEATGGKLGKHAKDNIKRKEFEADVIQGLEEGTILPSDAAEMLRIPEEELDEIINKFEDEKRKNSLKIK